MQTYKSIAYAYPTSPSAIFLDMGETGCYFIQQRVDNENYSDKSFIAHNTEGFLSPNHPDLIALYHEYEGDICPMFAKHGNPQALEAIEAKQ